ncbi:MAG: DUF5686 and carboxypeptidase regulatory-like domain-containing protein [Bacteroidales bacterium]|nr:DUF5686 and carboxypeptidase regulatory-like domain-containing protein [Bacteroidales bacterium]
MKKLIFCIVIGLLFTPFALAQTLKGRITDTDGQPIPAASVYIPKTKQGVISDADGNFQIRLAPGTYRLECSSMGYTMQTKEINIAANETLTIQFVLPERVFSLQEVTISGKEDPALAIMRKAIEKAPYYQNVVKKSIYEAYIKGSGKFSGSSGFLDGLSGGQIGFYKDKLFLQESVSEYTFTAPDKYEKTVKAFSSTFPNDFDPQNSIRVGMFSLYSPMIGNVVSPLNPNAFSHYRFRYEGFVEENGQTINIIRVTPRLKDPRFLEGILYIAENEWNIRHAKYTLNQPFIRMKERLNYSSVADGIYLITSSQADIEVNILGLTLEANFLSSIQFHDIQLNDSLIAVEKSQAKPEEKPRRERRELEIKKESRFRTTVDSLAVERDSIFWLEARTVALTEEEQQSYIRKDSVQAHTDSLIQAEDNPKFKFSDLIFGGRVGSDSAFVRFRYDGLLGGLLKEYNFVDGLWMGQSFSLDFKKRKKTGWIVEPAVYWTSARQSLIWQTDISLDYDPRRLGRLEISAGQTSTDYAGNDGMSRFLNSAFSILDGRNYAKFYEKTFGQISNQIDIANGLQLGLEAELADRHTSDNHTTWNLFNRKNRWHENVPNYDQPLNETYSRLARGGIRLRYTPEYFYRMYADGSKKYVRSRFPTFTADYQQGISGFSDKDYSTFSRVELSINQNISLGLFDNFTYRLVGGRFFNKNPFNYMDYKHFNTGGNLWVGFSNWRTSYVLLPFYTYSTNEHWIQAFATYQTDYLVVKRLPFMQGRLITESLHVKFLHTPEKPYYSELGYSIDWISGIASAGVFVSFDSFKYNSVGFQISVPLFNKNRNQQEIVISF